MQLVMRDMRFMAMKLVHNHLHELDSIVPALAVLYGSISSFSITRRPITDTHDGSLANISHGILFRSAWFRAHPRLILTRVVPSKTVSRCQPDSPARLFSFLSFLPPQTSIISVRTSRFLVLFSGISRFLSVFDSAHPLPP